jgi:cytochrome c oxidase assembly protein subunit 15
VWAFLVVAVLVLRRVERGDAGASAVARGRVLVGAIVAQGALGYVQYAAGVPEILVGGHVLGSVIVWVSVLRFHLALTEVVPADDAATVAVDQRSAEPAPVLPVSSP